MATATFMGKERPEGEEAPSIMDDFMYGSNVASSHVYIRMGFLRKVYGILTAQLLLTTLTGALFLAHEPTRNYVQANQWPFLVSAVASFGLLFALMFKSKEVPTNYILLGLFTLCEAVVVGTAVTFYDVAIVLQAFALTFIVTVALTVYTLQSKRDFSSWGAALFASLWIMIWALVFQMFFQSPIIEMALSVGGALLFSLFIIYDTHMIMHKVSPEEYIHAAINLYLDIINLFLHILRIMAEARRN